jgi:hypothetical protein
MKSSSGAIRESTVLVENDERGDHAGYPSAGRQQEHDEDASTPPIQNGQGREQYGEQDLQHSHDSNVTEGVMQQFVFCW